MAQRSKIGPGEIIKSVHHMDWNNSMAAGEAYAQSLLDQPGGGRVSPRRTDIITVKNSSGAARARGEVLGAFGKDVTNLEAGQIRLTGTAPAAGKAFGVCRKAHPSGEYGELQLAGACIATVNVSSTAHQFADISAGAYKLVSAESGPVRIVWQPGTTGDQDCFVLLGGGSGVCTPTTYITAMQNTGAALQYKTYDTTTCEESAWTTLIELTSDCPTA